MGKRVDPSRGTKQNCNRIRRADLHIPCCVRNCACRRIQSYISARRPQYARRIRRRNRTVPVQIARAARLCAGNVKRHCHQCAKKEDQLGFSSHRRFYPFGQTDRPGFFSRISSVPPRFPIRESESNTVIHHNTFQKNVVECSCGAIFPKPRPVPGQPATLRDQLFSCNDLKG